MVDRLSWISKDVPWNRIHNQFMSHSWRLYKHSMPIAGHIAVTGYAKNKLALLLPSMLLLLLLRVSDRRSACSANEPEKLRSYKRTHTDSHTALHTHSCRCVGQSDLGKTNWETGPAGHRFESRPHAIVLTCTWLFISVTSPSSSSSLSLSASTFYPSQQLAMWKYRIQKYQILNS